MSTDFEKGTKKTIDISVKAKEITSDILKSAISELLDGKAENKGRMSFNQLQKKSKSKLQDFEFSEKNIGDFLASARKYDIDFAVKKDNTTSPPTFHIFFSADKSENFKKAFNEFSGRTAYKQVEAFTSRENLKRDTFKISQQPKKKQKEREKTRENMR